MRRVLVMATVIALLGACRATAPARDSSRALSSFMECADFTGTWVPTECRVGNIPSGHYMEMFYEVNGPRPCENLFATKLITSRMYQDSADVTGGPPRMFWTFKLADEASQKFRVTEDPNSSQTTKRSSRAFGEWDKARRVLSLVIDDHDLVGQNDVDHTEFTFTKNTDGSLAGRIQHGFAASEGALAKIILDCKLSPKKAF